MKLAGLTKYGHCGKNPIDLSHKVYGILSFIYPYFQVSPPMYP